MLPAARALPGVAAANGAGRAALTLVVPPSAVRSGVGAVLGASYWWIQRRRKARACELRRVAGRE